MTPYPWQHRQWERLQHQRQQGKLPHAVMLLGHQGLGLNHFARLFAQSLFCHAPLENAVACGQCPACRQFEQSVYPDYVEVQPEEDKRSVVVDQIRELNDFLSLTHGGRSAKVVVLSPAEAMNINASNSLLKTLEEPPGEALLLLVAHTISTLPATVKSRCQFVRFDVPDHAMAVQWLKSQAVTQIDERLQLAGGAPCRAKSLPQTYLDQYQRTTEGLLAVLSGKQAVTALRPGKDDADVRAYVEWTHSLLRDLIRAQCNTSDSHFENRFYISVLRQLATSVDSRVLYRANDRVAQIRGALDHPLNAELVVDDLLLTWASVKPQP
ncbi:MAG: DNA polymerase III subunit delta' [Thiotrichales bacterium]